LVALDQYRWAAAAASAASASGLADPCSDAAGLLWRRDGCGCERGLYRGWLFVQFGVDAGHAVQVRACLEHVVDVGSDEPGGDHGFGRVLPDDEQAVCVRWGGCGLGAELQHDSHL